MNFDAFYYFDVGYVAVPIKENTTLIPITFGICRYIGKYDREYYFFDNFDKRMVIRPYFGFETGVDCEYNYDAISIKKAHIFIAPVFGISRLLSNRWSIDVKGQAKFNTGGIMSFGINLGIGFLQ